MRSLYAARRRTRRARIEMVPLIDCMFLLLTFFIYVATTMVIQRGIPLHLATATTGDSEGREPFPTVSIDQEGRLYLNKVPITEERLREELRGLAASSTPNPVIIHADKGVVHEQVVGVLDLARQCGVPDVIFAVEPRPARQGALSRGTAP